MAEPISTSFSFSSAWWTGTTGIPRPMEVEVGATSTATEVVLLSSESVPMMVMTGIWRPGLVIMLFIIFIVVGDGAEFVCELIGVAATIAAPLSKTSAIVDEIFIVLEFLLDFEVQ